MKKTPENTGEGIWINRRESGNANIPDLESLSLLVDLAHAQGKKVYLTLNQPGYAQDLYDEILAFVREVKRSCWVDAFIVADPGRIWNMRSLSSTTGVCLRNPTAMSVISSAAPSVIIRPGGIG